MRREARDGRGSRGLRDGRIVGQRIRNVVELGRIFWFADGADGADGAENVDGINGGDSSGEQVHEEYRGVRHDGWRWKICVAIGYWE